MSTTPPSPVVREDNDNRGDLMISGFWSHGTNCIVDVRITDLDSKSYLKRSYLAPCLAQQRHFTPFVSSTYGLIGKEGQTFAKRLAGLLSDKWRRPYSQVCGYVNARLSIALVRATHRCLRGSRVPAPLISVKYAQWEDGAARGTR
eukprot:scaffold3218_cov63-Attheya_sp.AAC.2